MEIKPINQRVVVLPETSEEKTKGGIYIPQKAQEEKLVANVIAVSEDVEKVKVGNKVMVGKYLGSEIVLNEVKHLVVKEEDIIGIVC